MKRVLVLSVLILLGSCGKYERPFITFKSPEKRLMGTSWRCVEAVKENGESIDVFDHITFEINNGDSTFVKISSYGPWTYDFNNSNNENDTIVGNWTWGYALEGNFNKQFITYQPQNLPLKHLRIKVLSKNKLVLQDQSFDNTIYHYAPL
jgi:hypothetical protein